MPFVLICYNCAVFQDSCLTGPLAIRPASMFLSRWNYKLRFYVYLCLWNGDHSKFCKNRSQSIKHHKVIIHLIYLFITVEIIHATCNNMKVFLHFATQCVYVCHPFLTITKRNSLHTSNLPRFLMGKSSRLCQEENESLSNIIQINSGLQIVR